MNNFDKIRDMLVESLGVNGDEITLESKLIEDLGADSLSLIEMLMDFEESYGITIPDESFENVETVGDVVSILDELDA